MTESIVEVKQGKLRGVIKETVYGFSYVSFTGIPFAAPPIGELRFKDPEPPASWEGIRDATINTDVAIQTDNNIVIGNEDCLYLNVFVPRCLNLKICKPVMIWIHGGGFTKGTGNIIKTRPDYLIEKDIVLVSINYRLGALGFFNLDHEVANGNQALKDQVAALKWIKENINVFGGDPNNITVFGCSAGAISAHLLAVSPLSKGLFHKLILQSCTATLEWTTSNKKSVIKCFQIASILGNDSKDPEEVIEFLRTIPAAKIIEAQYKVCTPEEFRVYEAFYAPTIDDKAKCPFLPCPISELIDDDNNIPIILGYATYEYMGLFKNVDQQILDTLYGNLPFYVERLVGSQEPKKMTRLVKRFKERYFNNEPVLTARNIPSIVKFMSDVHITTGVKIFADNRRKKKKQAATYLYQFSFVGNQNAASAESSMNVFVPGATHADEVVYLFYVPQNKIGDSQPPAIGTDEFKVVEALRSMWTNFAKTGNPTYVVNEYVTTNWIPATEDTFYYLDIDKDLRLLTVTDYDDKLLKD